MLKLRTKQSILLLLMIMLVFSSINGVWAEEIPSYMKEPRLYVKNTELPQVMKGDTFDLTLDVTNESIYGAIDIEILPGLEGTPFVSTEMQNRQKINRILANSQQSVTFKFRVKEDTPVGVYPLVLTFDYKNFYRDEYRGHTRTIYIEVLEAPSLPALEVIGIKPAVEKFVAGKTNKVELFVKNLGERSAKDIELRLLNLSQDWLSLINDVNLRKADSLDGGGDLSFFYNITANKNLSTGGYKLAYELAFTDEYGSRHKHEGEVFLYITASEEKQEEEPDSTNTVPKIIVSSYGTDPMIVHAGENFKLNISFQNTSKTRTVRNIKISLMAPTETGQGSAGSGDVFTPVNSSNTLFIDEIPPTGIVSRQMPFYAVLDAQPKTYKVDVNFNYEDTKGKEYIAQETIGIRAVQQARLEVSDPQFPAEAYVGDYMGLYTEFYNMGRSTIHNLMVKVEGDFDVSAPTYFVGNFDTGTRDYLDTGIILNQPGVCQGRLIFTYEDAAGVKQEDVREFTVNVMEREPFPDEAMPVEPGGFDPGMPDGGMAQPFYKNPKVWIGVAILIAAIFIVRKLLAFRKKKQIEQDLLKDISKNE